MLFLWDNAVPNQKWRKAPQTIAALINSPTEAGLGTAMQAGPLPAPGAPEMFCQVLYCPSSIVLLSGALAQSGGAAITRHRGAKEKGRSFRRSISAAQYKTALAAEFWQIARLVLAKRNGRRPRAMGGPEFVTRS